MAPEDPWSDPADPYALVILISADTETENVPDPVKEEIVSPHTESDDEKEAWSIPLAVPSLPEPTRPQLAESVATTDVLGRRCKSRPQPPPHPPLYPPPKHLFGT